MASALGVWVCVSVCACLGLCVLVRELSVCDEVVCGAKLAAAAALRVEVSVGCANTLSRT